MENIITISDELYEGICEELKLRLRQLRRTAESPLGGEKAKARAKANLDRCESLLNALYEADTYCD